MGLSTQEIRNMNVGDNFKMKFKEHQGDVNEDEVFTVTGVDHPYWLFAYGPESEDIEIAIDDKYLKDGVCTDIYDGLEFTLHKV